MEYFKLELALILPDIIEAKAQIDKKYGGDLEKNANKISKGKKKLKKLIEQKRQQVLEKQLSVDFSMESFKQLITKLKSLQDHEATKLYEEYKLIAGMVSRVVGKDDIYSSRLDATLNEDMDVSPGLNI